MSNKSAVLLVDDNLDLLENLVEVLEDEDIEAVIADSGPAALAHLEARPFKLVVTDMRMPGMDGLALLREVHLRWPELPTVVMTAYSVESMLDKAQAEGALGVLPKPLDLEYLVSLVGRLVSPSSAVLLVEDDDDLRVNLTESLLTTGDVIPHPVASVEAARSLLDAVPFRAAVIDVRLPDGDGTELGRALRAHAAERAIPIIYITGYGAELQETLRNVIESTRVHLLEKPFSPADLIQLIRDAL